MITIWNGKEFILSFSNGHKVSFNIAETKEFEAWFFAKAGEL